MAPELRIHLSRPDRTDALRDELQRRYPGAKHHVLAPGLIESELPPGASSKHVVLAFAQQVLPEVEAVEGGSINALAAAAGGKLIEQLKLHAGPWRLHVFPLTSEASGGRARLVEEALDAFLQKKQRRLRRTRNAESESPWLPDEALVQIGLRSNTHAWLSVALPTVRHALRHVLSPFVGGVCNVPRDPRPPSRAYQKLVEAELRLGRPIAPGETVVDLGASPGGWTFIALERGARVTAVDRSPLRDDLMRNPHLSFFKGDAFTWHPAGTVDWLVCDLIAFPERTLELIDDWLGNRRCRNFVVTMKFRGSEDYARVDALAKLLERHAGSFQLRQLTANKNEVTAMGTLRPEAPRAVLFDLDGVLVKSEEAWFHVVAEAGERFRGRAITREEFAPTFGQGTEADIAHFGLACSATELNTFYADNFGKYGDKVWVNPEAAPLLQGLRERGLPLAVVTNTVTPLAHEILRAAKLDGYFAFIACADQVPRPKPAPDLVLHGAARLGVRPQDAWMIGDSRYDRGAAGAAGVRFVGLGIDGDARVEHLRELAALVAAAS